MDREKVRNTLDAMDDDELLKMRDEIEASPEGSTHELAGEQVGKDQALLFINQAMVMEGPNQ